MDPTYDEHGNRRRLAALSEKGVTVWGPERVYVGEDVCLDRVCAGATLLNAHITGKSSFIGAGAQIGTSGLARIHDAQIGSHAILGAGSYESCVLLASAKARGFADVRPGTILEEEAEIAHNVGLKNTVLTVAVVAGSSINFCDVLLTGGSSRRDHSEIGSGAVHFNFDPRGDKFGSLMGNATGCLLRSRRIFVGGNSGIVAPVHLDFGAVVAAGSMVRKDVGENQLSFGDSAGRGGDYDLERYYDLGKKFTVTAKLIGELCALRAWYRHVRLPFAASEEGPLYLAAAAELARHVKHRCEQLAKVIEKLERSVSLPAKTGQDKVFHKQHRMLLDQREDILGFLLSEECSAPPLSFVAEYESHRGEKTHIDSIRALSAESAGVAAEWLCKIGGRPLRQMRKVFDSL
jgi:bifunctional UDP-N-acetylglucosamine pyrophosphorylase / glucosamine-1-phosphate N-acetyltransferase